MVMVVWLQFLARRVLCLFDGGPILSDSDLVHQLHSVFSHLQGGPMRMELQLGFTKGRCLLEKPSTQVHVVGEPSDDSGADSEGLGYSFQTDGELLCSAQGGHAKALASSSNSPAVDSSIF